MIYNDSAINNSVQSFLVNPVKPVYVVSVPNLTYQVNPVEPVLDCSPSNWTVLFRAFDVTAEFVGIFVGFIARNIFSVEVHVGLVQSLYKQISRGVVVALVCDKTSNFQHLFLHETDGESSIFFYRNAIPPMIIAKVSYEQGNTL